MKQLYFALFFIVLNVGYAATAQNFSTRVSATTIGKGDVLQVEYIVENLELQDLVLPAFSGWKIISGPNFSSNRLQTGNIVKQQTLYTILLQPQATGKLAVPGAKAIVDGKTRLSNTISVLVKNVAHVQGNQQANNAPPANNIVDKLFPDEEEINDNQVLKGGEDARQKINNNLLVKLDVSKTNPYVGEPVLATYKLCTRIRSQSRVVKQPAFSGCTVVEMTNDETLPQKEKIGNKWYNVYVVRQVQLIPLQSGLIELPETSVENKVTFYREGSFSYRDLFYGNPNAKAEVETVTFSSKPVTMQIKPLPQLMPADFSGAVGNFSITMVNNSKGGITNNNNQVLVNIKGRGNLQAIKMPFVAWPKGLEGFDPTEKEALDKTLFPSPVIKTFAYPFVAAKAGNYALPPVSFTYFNTNDNKYTTVTSNGLTIRIDKVTTVVATKQPANSTADFYNRLYILLGGALITVLLGLFYFYRKPTPTVSAPAAVAVVTKPTEPIPTDTAQFVYNLQQLDPLYQGAAFYKLMNKNIVLWLQAKFNITPRQIDEVSDGIPQLAMNLQKISAVLQACNIGMYTPLSSIEDAIEQRQNVLEAINQLEKMAGNS